MKKFIFFAFFLISAQTSYSSPEVVESVRSLTMSLRTLEPREFLLDGPTLRKKLDELLSKSSCDKRSCQNNLQAATHIFLNLYFDKRKEALNHSHEKMVKNLEKARSKALSNWRNIASE